MRLLIQRVSEASVTIDRKVKSSTGKGLLVFLGIEDSDTEEDIDFLCKKTVNLRIFDDENGVMNKSVLETGGEILVVSQFTLYGDCRKGKRPSFIAAARPEIAIPLYERFVAELRDRDRVEIYRPLIADPKAVRKKRADEGKVMKKGGGPAEEQA